MCFFHANRFYRCVVIDCNHEVSCKSKVKVKCKPIWWWAKRWAHPRESIVNHRAAVLWQLLFTEWSAPDGDTPQPNKVDKLSCQDQIPNIKYHQNQDQTIDCATMAHSFGHNNQQQTDLSCFSYVTVGVLTSTAAVQQLHRTSTRRATASSSSSTAQGALDRLRAFSSIRRQPATVPAIPAIPAISAISSGINQNGSGTMGVVGVPQHPSSSTNSILQASLSSPPKLRPAVDLTDPANSHPNKPVSIPSSRHPLQASRSFHDMPKCYTVQEHVDDDEIDDEKERPNYVDNEQVTSHPQ